MKREIWRNYPVDGKGRAGRDPARSRHLPPTDGASRSSPAAVARPAARSPDRRAPPRTIRARWRAQRSEVHHHCGTGAPCSTSAMRARVRGRRLGGKRVDRKEPGRDDLAVRPVRRRLVEIAHDIERDMVATGNPRIEVRAVQHRRSRDLDVPLFHELARERLKHRFAGLDPAARQMPPVHIAMLDEEDASLIIDDEGAHAERHAAAEAPIGMQRATDRRLAGAPQIRQAFAQRVRRSLVCSRHRPIAAAASRRMIDRRVCP